MRYKSFRIQNFKGIKDTTINVDEFAGASVFAFVGLNESGKTTILQAIHSFSPDDTTSKLLSGEKGVGVPISDRVPRHEISTFTGSVSVTAVVSGSDDDIDNIISHLKDEGIIVDKKNFPRDFAFERTNNFKGGDHISDNFSLETQITVKTGKQRKFRKPNKEESLTLKNTIYNETPDIAYFPSFVFDFPKSVKLTKGGNPLHIFYKDVFQDVLNHIGKGHEIEKDIIRRLRKDEFITPWDKFASIWFTSSDKSKVDHIFAQASATLTKLIFGKWNEIFGEDATSKEILITHVPAQGTKKMNQVN